MHSKLSLIQARHDGLASSHCVGQYGLRGWWGTDLLPSLATRPASGMATLDVA